MVELVDHVRLGRPEATREGEELRRSQRLRSQGEHVVLVERALELGERGVGQRRGQVDAFGLDAETGEGREADHLRNSGETILGRMSAMSGQMISIASTSSIGTSMIIVSLSA